MRKEAQKAMPETEFVAFQNELKKESLYAQYSYKKLLKQIDNRKTELEQHLNEFLIRIERVKTRAQTKIGHPPKQII